MLIHNVKGAALEPPGGTAPYYVIGGTRLSLPPSHLPAPPPRRCVGTP